MNETKVITVDKSFYELNLAHKSQPTWVGSSGLDLVW